MNYKEFQSITNQSDVDNLWNNIQSIPEKVFNENWKYLLKREDKKIPFKWFISQLAESKDIDLDFSSDYKTRNKFCDTFNFEIEEELVYDKLELNKFKSFYENIVLNKSNFQDFIDYTNMVLLQVGINPYNIRMAITHSNEAKVIIGRRSILSYNNNKIGLIVKQDVLQSISGLNYEFDYNFKGDDNVSFIYLNLKISDIPDIIKESNYNIITNEYKLVANISVVKWSVEAKTTNSTLKYILFKGENVESFIKNNQEFQMEYFDLDNILKYKELINERYESNSEACKIFNDTRTKINYLAEILSKRLNVKLINNYNERINKQAGQGNNYHNYKDYILVGFLPGSLKFLEDNVFIKFSFGFWKSLPEFHYQVDVNYKKADNPYKKDRDFFLTLNPLSLTVDNSFPANWNDLLEKTFQNFQQIIEGLEEHFNKVYNYENNSNSKKNSQNMPLNQILYGAPGTGKTYLTKKLAVEIIEGKKFGNGIIERKEINKKYQDYVESKQIRFTTFHQSLSYEDFIEGIKPKLNGADKEIEYEVKDGIFKSICKDATQQKQSNNFEEAYNKFVDDVSETDAIELKSLIQQKPFNVRINSNQNCVAIPHTETKTNMVITKKMIEEYVINDKIIDWKTYTTTIGEHIKKQYNVVVEESDNQNKNYVLIIDEINRGNVSSVFGELITLLEEDKRKGKSEEIVVDLPYSQQKFSVPKNVYIIGTMNTADRSVEALDTALRRRFSFLEMQPNPQLLKSHKIIYNALWKWENSPWDSSEWINIESGLNELFGFNNYWNERKKELWDKFIVEKYNIEHSKELISLIDNNLDLENILSTINQRIEFLIDKDHQIGHSYFFKVKNFTDLVEVFRDKIIPLLEEYFYGDFGKIGLVLGNRFIKPKTVTSNKILAQNFKYNTDLLDEKELFEFISYKNWNIDTFKSIYQKITGSEQE